jgi:hypothetical protein
MSSSDRVAQIYPQAPGSLFVAFYDLQGYAGGIPTRLHTGLQTLILRLNNIILVNISFQKKSDLNFD